MMRWLFVAVVFYAGLGCSQDKKWAAGAVATGSDSDGQRSDRATLPVFSAGMTITEVHGLLLEHSQQFPSEEMAKVNYGACPLVHQFSFERNGNSVLAMSGRLMVYAEHYFIFQSGHLDWIVKQPPEAAKVGDPVDPEVLADGILNAPALDHHQLMDSVNDDLRIMKETEHMMEPPPLLPVLLFFFPKLKEGEKYKPIDEHNIVRWRLGESPAQFDAMYGEPLRIIHDSDGRSTRLYVAKDGCGGHFAATFDNARLIALYSHDCFDPRFWLDRLGEPHSPPWNPFEILAKPPAAK